MTTYISYVYEPCMLISQIKERGTGAPSDSLFAKPLSCAISVVKNDCVQDRATTSFVYRR